ncbi:MAG: hypothetical protein JSV16_10545, partial [Candidatus Hydrogenedentota bacterium]
MSESLVSGFGFEVAAELESWRGFGVATGNDGKLYSIFGPGQPLFCTPFVKLAKAINGSKWYELSDMHLPRSHYATNGLDAFLRIARLEDPEPHALRFVVSYFYVIASALGVVVFWLIIQAMVPSPRVAFSVAVFYAFGTIIWPYSGTFFSEPLATLFVLISFYLLIRNDPHFRANDGSISQLGLFSAGLSLGTST